MIFREVDRFFSSITNYVTYNTIFIICIALFLFAIFCVVVSTSHAYEAKLIKAIDMFNNYFLDHQQINEDNLVIFNNKMKSRKVPKLLRKQWQQYVLYREEKASYYMSFDTCVSIPMKNSSYKRDVMILNIISYILASASLILNLYNSYETELFTVLQRVLLCPVIILLLNFLVTIFLELRHNAIVSDLQTSYQYFEVNIDKATQTLPEYVDYEVLFDKNEIKRGIPILYAYLQKRAEAEQKELERARLKNIEHEKFNFDEAGIESSLVLERAMEEAENYIAERKRYMQDMEQINEEISQEEINFREITKDHQRQMQISKEAFENFRTLLEEADSSIQVNYLKKQQQQELDRQRNLERDYDTATDRHKKVMENYQAELNELEVEVTKSRKNLERAMMSEFSSYSSKVYKEAEKVAQQAEQEKVDQLKQDVKDLEEKLLSKDEELDNIYTQHQQLSEQLAQYTSNEQPVEEYPQTESYQVNDEYANDQQEYYDDQYQEESDHYDAQEGQEQPQEYYDENAEDDFDDKPQNDYDDLDDDLDIDYNDDEALDAYLADDDEEEEQTEPANPNVMSFEDYLKMQSGKEQSANGEMADNSTIQVESTPKKKAGRPRKVVEEIVEQPKRSVGRPKKQVEASVEPKRSVGRPKKVVEQQPEPKRSVGRPRKIVEQLEEQPKRSVGRPRKEVEVSTEPKRSVGRPRKVVEQTEEQPKRSVGRPKKEQVEVVKEPKRRGRPKKVEETDKQEEPKRSVGRPKKVEPASVAESAENKAKSASVPTEEKPTTKAGRPKKKAPEVEAQKSSGSAKADDIDLFLSQINDEIKKENAKLEESKKQFEAKSKIGKK